MKPVSKTAYYCCGIRMADARSARPVCGDNYAERFMNAEGLAIHAQFAALGRPNVSNVSRARYIDDLLRERLARNPQLQVLLIGCGFDSRAFRLAGGSWTELDEPALIAYKNERLPSAGCPNPLRRVAIDFATELLSDKLAGLSRNAETVVVIEGVTMYVTAESLSQTLAVLKATLPAHEIIADLMTRSFLERYGKPIRSVIEGLGAQMIPGEDPARPFAESGYRETSRQSVVQLGLRYGGRGWLAHALASLSPGLFAGYSVRSFVPKSSTQ
jgi:methyltransferase (TIGR00027 family)